LIGIVAITTALLGSAVVAAAQMELGSVQGTVKDEMGQPLEGVTITLRDTGRGRSVQVKTDKSGRFFQRSLQAGNYELVVEKAGFNAIRDSLQVSAGLDKRYDFKLVKGAPDGAEDFNRGVQAFNRGDNAAAVQAFEETLKKAPNLPEVHVNLALAYFRLSRTNDAVAHLEKARELAPDTPTVLFQLGEAYITLKDYDKAVAAIEQGLAKVTTPTDAVAIEGQTTLGAVYFAKGDNDKAIVAFEKALAAKADVPAAQLGVAKAYFSKGDLEKALQNFKQVASSAPGSAEAAEANTFIGEISKSRPQ
jgi:tetratricopeptide (TPR) repeat protein